MPRGRPRWTPARASSRPSLAIGLRAHTGGLCAHRRLCAHRQLCAHRGLRAHCGLCTHRGLRAHSAGRDVMGPAEEGPPTAGPSRRRHLPSSRVLGARRLRVHPVIRHRHQRLDDDRACAPASPGPSACVPRGGPSPAGARIVSAPLSPEPQPLARAYAEVQKLSHTTLLCQVSRIVPVNGSSPHAKRSSAEGSPHEISSTATSRGERIGDLNTPLIPTSCTDPRIAGERGCGRSGGVVLSPS